MQTALSALKTRMLIAAGDCATHVCLMRLRTLSLEQMESAIGNVASAADLLQRVYDCQFADGKEIDFEWALREAAEQLELAAVTLRGRR